MTGPTASNQESRHHGAAIWVIPTAPMDPPGAPFLQHRQPSTHDDDLVRTARRAVRAGIRIGHTALDLTPRVEAVRSNPIRHERFGHPSDTR
jgi:hypothetical protein